MPRGAQGRQRAAAGARRRRRPARACRRPCRGPRAERLGPARGLRRASSRASLSVVWRPCFAPRIAAPERVLLRRVAEEVAAASFLKRTALPRRRGARRARAAGGRAARATAKASARPAPRRVAARRGASAPAPPTGAARRRIVVLLDRARRPRGAAAPRPRARSRRRTIEFTKVTARTTVAGAATAATRRRGPWICASTRTSGHAQHAARSFPGASSRVDAPSAPYALASRNARASAAAAGAVRRRGRRRSRRRSASPAPAGAEEAAGRHTAVRSGPATKRRVDRARVPRYAEAEEPRAAAADVEGLLRRRGQGHRRRQAAAARRRGPQGFSCSTPSAALAAAAGCAEARTGPLARGVAAIGEARKRRRRGAGARRRGGRRRGPGERAGPQAPGPTRKTVLRARVQGPSKNGRGRAASSAGWPRRERRGAARPGDGARPLLVHRRRPAAYATRRRLVEAAGGRPPRRTPAESDAAPGHRGRRAAARLRRRGRGRLRFGDEQRASRRRCPRALLRRAGLPSVDEPPSAVFFAPARRASALHRRNDRDVQISRA